MIYASLQNLHLLPNIVIGRCIQLLISIRRFKYLYKYQEVVLKIILLALNYMYKYSINSYCTSQYILFQNDKTRDIYLIKYTRVYCLNVHRIKYKGKMRKSSHFKFFGNHPLPYVNSYNIHCCNMLKIGSLASFIEQIGKT
jgi:hypothetical protein